MAGYPKASIMRQIGYACAALYLQALFMGACISGGTVVHEAGRSRELITDSIDGDGPLFVTLKPGHKGNLTVTVLFDHGAQIPR